MAPKTTPQRLRQIIDLLTSATTFEQQKTVRDALTHDEFTDYEAWAQDLPGAIQPISPEEMAAEQLSEEIAADAAELAQERPEELKKLEEELSARPSEARYIGRTPPIPAPKRNQPTVKPTLIIERVPYPKWWRDSLNATINLTAPATQTLATATRQLRLFLAAIVITVTDETQITIKFGDAGSSGPIYLGGEGQPKGFVAAMGNSPAPCGRGNLTITATDPAGVAPSIGGWATFFVEEL